jgi:hypothetical protein
MITAETVTVNIKGIPTYSIPDHSNFYLTSNQSDAFFLDDKDRRFFVHEVTAPSLGAAFFVRFHAWMGTCLQHPEPGPGPAALLAYAQTLDFSGFEPWAPARMTLAKADMIDAGKGELELWVTELSREPAAKLHTGRVESARDLFTARELIAFFEAERKGPPVAANTMGKRLRGFFPKAYRGIPLKPSGHSEVFFIIRNVDRWANATRPALEAHVRTLRSQEIGGRKF